MTKVQDAVERELEAPAGDRDRTIKKPELARTEDFLLLSVVSTWSGVGDSP
jgi:hypothetical protein